MRIKNIFNRHQYYFAEIIYFNEISNRNYFLFTLICELSTEHYTDFTLDKCLYFDNKFKYFIACILYRLFLLLK